MSISDLPALNATLNAIATLFLTAGFLFIRKGRVTAHRLSMSAAFLVSIAFLASYLTYHACAGSTPYPGRGAIRAVYFAILISHIVLAAAVPPLAVVTLYRALRGRFESHRRLARWTLPIWLYVSVTGVVVYLMLYR